VPLGRARREQVLRPEPVGRREREPVAGAALLAPELRACHRRQRGQSLAHVHVLARHGPRRELPLQGRRVAGASQQSFADRPRAQVRLPLVHRRCGREQHRHRRPPNAARRQRRQLQEPHHRSYDAGRARAVCRRRCRERLRQRRLRHRQRTELHAPDVRRPLAVHDRRMHVVGLHAHARCRGHFVLDRALHHGRRVQHLRHLRCGGPRRGRRRQSVHARRLRHAARRAAHAGRRGQRVRQ